MTLAGSIDRTAHTGHHFTIGPKTRLCITMVGVQPGSSLGSGIRSYRLNMGLRGISLGKMEALHLLLLPAPTSDLMNWSTAVSFLCSDAWCPHPWQFSRNCRRVLQTQIVVRIKQNTCVSSKVKPVDSLFGLGWLFVPSAAARHLYALAHHRHRTQIKLVMFHRWRGAIGKFMYVNQLGVSQIT